MSRTLVVHTGGIGDFLLMAPVLGLLAQAGPIELLGRVERLDLAVAGGIATAAQDMDTIEFHTLFSNPSKTLRRYLARFDRAVVWMEDDGEIRRALQTCGVRDVRTFPGVPPKDWAEHSTKYYLACLGFDEASPLQLAIGPGPTAHDVVVHPGSGGRGKNWPIEHFEAVAAALEARGRTVTWCVGPADHETVLPIDRPLIAPKSLVELAQALAAARLYLGNDSGITHLAACVACPTVAIFGPTNPRVWAPRGSHVKVVQGTPWPETTAVLAAID